MAPQPMRLLMPPPPPPQNPSSARSPCSAAQRSAPQGFSRSAAPGPRPRSAPALPRLLEFPGPAALHSDPCINLVTNLCHTPPRDPITGAATSPFRPLQPLCEHPKAPRLSLRYSNWVVGYSDAPGTARRRCSAAHTRHRRRTRRPEPQSAALSGQVDYACHGDAPRPSPGLISAL